MSETINTEPSMDELTRVFNWSLLVTKYAPKTVKEASIADLRKLRDARSTFSGADEVVMSRLIDKHLRENEG